MSDTQTPPSPEAPQFRYTSAFANEIEAKWQDFWEQDHTFWAPNATGPLSEPNGERSKLPKKFVLDMFPYPSGAGLHVGHPLGFIGTDVYARYMRMLGYNVLHSMGYDAFGLPAEQYAVQTGQHPAVTTLANITTYRAQLRALGLGHDPRRGVSTTDPEYYRFTQWIFLQVFNSWYDESNDCARHVNELIAELHHGTRLPDDGGAPWAERDALAQRRYVDDHRLAYIGEAPVNWCPGLGTVLANEEVTADGRSERGNFPVYKRPLKQWMMRITKYADRLLADLDLLDWTDSIKLMQRNWIGKSLGAEVDFPVVGLASGGSVGPLGVRAQASGGSVAPLGARAQASGGSVAPLGARAPASGGSIRVFTTRPDTLFGATYMVLAPEHELIDHIVANEWPECPVEWKGLFGTDRSPAEAVAAYRAFASSKSELERTSEGKDKTGVFTGAFAINPVNGQEIPVFIADYVLTGYGTGAIMAVPAHDQRDFEFAREFALEIVSVITPSNDWLAAHDGAAIDDCSTWSESFGGDGAARNSGNETVTLDGLFVAEAKVAITQWLTEQQVGAATTNYKLRDWLFSRQRYWGEPFPIIYDEHGPIAVPDSMLPVLLPEITNFEPATSDDPDALPSPPLARAEDWVIAELDLGDGRGTREYRREVNTMPQWAGSCWYYLRYLDPTNGERFVDRDVEHYWADTQETSASAGALGRASAGERGNAGALGGASAGERGRSGAFAGASAGERGRSGALGGANAGERGHAGLVDLYVGGVEHAVLHLLYARFWHKVLFDLGHVSTPEPFQRLFNQGYIQAYAFTDARGVYVEAREVIEDNGTFSYNGEPVNREYGKIGKSLKNVVTPDDMCAEYGADTFRMYEMFMGPMDASRPWSTRDVVGVNRFLQRLWRNCVDEFTGESRVTEAVIDDDTRRIVHRSIAAVTHDMPSLGFNTVVARLFELNNHLTKVVEASGGAPRQIVEPLILMTSPLAPHIAEELWRRVGHTKTCTYEPFPVHDPKWLVAETVEIPVQVNGKVRSKITVASDADQASCEAAARADEKIVELLTDATVRKVVVVAGRMVNFVVG